MNPAHVVQIAAELAVRPGQVQATAELLEGGATVPFIARYRKEATGTLDEVAIMAIRTRLTQLAELDARREAILASLQERNLLTEELKAQDRPSRHDDRPGRHLPALPPEAADACHGGP